MYGKYGKNNRETSFTAKGLSKEGANKYMFPFMDKATGQEKQMSVAAYFSNILGIKLEFPALQCVTVRPLASLPLQLPLSHGVVGSQGRCAGVWLRRILGAGPAPGSAAKSHLDQCSMKQRADQMLVCRARAGRVRRLRFPWSF